MTNRDALIAELVKIKYNDGYDWGRIVDMIIKKEADYSPYALIRLKPLWDEFGYTETNNAVIEIEEYFEKENNDE